MKSLLNLLGVRGDFDQLFFINEYKTLAGSKRQIILILIIIMFFTFLALGFAVGSIQNLKQKMNNPFTNWVDLAVSDDVSASVPEIMQDFDSDVKKQNFQLNEIRGSVRFFLEMYRQEFNPYDNGRNKDLYGTWGFTIDYDDKLLDQILSQENILWKQDNIGTAFENSLDNCEIIISEEMLLRLKFDPKNDELGNIFILTDDNPLPMKVVAVVKELPKLSDFVCAPKTYNILTGKKDGIVYCNNFLTTNEEGKSSFIFMADDLKDTDQVQQLAKSFYTLDQTPIFKIVEEVVSGNRTIQICEIYFDPSSVPDFGSFPIFLEYLSEQGIKMSEVNMIECSSDKCDQIPSEGYYYLAFNFARLDNIRDFKSYMKEEHFVDIDMTQVEAKENFALVSKLTFIISLILLAFGILSIILFVNSLLRAHLNAVRSNLGTFKAFGLSNKFLNSNYLKIIFFYLVFAILVALAASIVVDRVEEAISQDESKFNIFSDYILYAILALIAISLYISSRTIKKILGDTPGNLIYER